MDSPKDGARANASRGLQATDRRSGEEDKGLPFSPTGEVTLSQAAWKKLDEQGYQVDVTRMEDRGAGEAGPKDTAAARERPKGLYDYLGKEPPIPRGTLLEENIYRGSGDYLRMGARPKQDNDMRLEGTRGPSLPRHDYQVDHDGTPPPQAEEKLFGLTGPLLDWARTGSRTEGHSARPFVTRPATQESIDVGIRQSGRDGHRPNLKPQLYDGGKPLLEYLSHFRVVASLNRWGDLEKGLYLAASLTGRRCGADRVMSWATLPESAPEENHRKETLLSLSLRKTNRGFLRTTGGSPEEKL